MSERHEADASEAAYQRQIVRLTQQRDRAREQRNAERVACRKEVRELSSRLAEAVSPQVEALKLAAKELRAERDDLLRGIDDKFKRLSGHFQLHHGMDPQQATDAALSILVGRNERAAGSRKVEALHAQSIEVSKELVELRRQEMLDIESTMRASPASTDHRGAGAYRPVPKGSTI